MWCFAVSVGESLAIQGGALAILGWAIWYLLAKALPQERDLFLAAQRETRKAFQRSLHTLAHSFECLASAVTGELISSEEDTPLSDIITKED